MKRLLTLCLLLWSFVARGGFELGDLQVMTWDLWPDLSLTTNAWSKSTTYLTHGSWYVRRTASEPQITATIPLGRTNPAGAYYFFVKGYQRVFDGSAWAPIEVQLGSGSYSNATFYSGIGYTRTNAYASAPFSTVTLRLTRTGTTSHDFYIEAFAITTNSMISAPTLGDSPSLAFTDVFLDNTWPTSTNPVVHPGNLLPNSSFETGWNRWQFERTTAMSSNLLYTPVLAEAWSSDGGRTGRSYARINDAKFRYSFIYAPVRLPRDLRNYTLSWYARSSSAGLSYSVQWKPLAAQSSYAAIPNPTGYTWNLSTTSTNWIRYSTNFAWAGVPTSEIRIDWYSAAASGAAYVDVDDVQLEEGTTATAYAQAEPVEIGVTSGRLGNLYGPSDTIDVSAVTYNSLAYSTNVSATVAVFDYLGRRVSYTTNTWTAASGGSTNSLGLSVTGYGTWRVQVKPTSARIPSDVETIFTVVPTRGAAALDAATTNQMYGIHSTAYQRWADTNRLWGLEQVRSLSPASFFRWWSIQTATNTWNWATNDYLVSQLEGRQMIFASLGDISYIPAWAKIGTYGMNTNAYYTFLTNIATRYLGRIKYYESYNEPNNFTNSDYAGIVKTEAAALKAIDPTCYYVAFGGMSDVTAVSNIWSLLDAGTIAKIDAVSIHLYPTIDNDVVAETPDDGDATRYAGFKTFFNSVSMSSIMNTEAGTWGAGPTRGEGLGWQTRERWAWPNQYHEYQVRGQTIEIMRVLGSALRSAGYGFTKFFLYDDRATAYFKGAALNGTATGLDYYDEVRPKLSAYIALKNFLDYRTNSSVVTNWGSKVECYVFGRTNGTMAALWPNDRTNRTITMSITNVLQYDVMGNLVASNTATISAGRLPVYVVDQTGRTPLQLSNILASASVAVASDTTAPLLSIDIAPSFVVTGATNRLYWKWTALDEGRLSSPVNPRQVLTRYKIEPALAPAWSTWDEYGAVEYNDPPNGTYTITVQAKDAASNTNETAMSFVVSGGSLAYPVISTTRGTANTVYGK